MCDAILIEIFIESTFSLKAAYGGGRADTEDNGGDQNNGFSFFFNWNLLTDGEHTISGRADRVEFTTTTFTVTTLGGEFMACLSSVFAIADFLEPGVNTPIIWVQSLQNFGVIGTDAALPNHRPREPYMARCGYVRHMRSQK